MNRNKCVWIIAGALAIGVLLNHKEANAKTYTFTATSSATGGQIAIDLDGSNCTTTASGTTCPSDAVLATVHGNQVGGPEKGPFDGQSVSEAVPVAGTGCLFAPDTVQSCSIGGVSDGCLFNYAGGDGVDRNVGTGDLLIVKLTSGSLCIEFDNGLPWPIEGQQVWSFTGGTGGYSNATGSFTISFHGQVLENDPQGHGFSWVAGTSQGTITVP